jgi:hypothetical protein
VDVPHASSAGNHGILLIHVDPTAPFTSIEMTKIRGALSYDYEEGMHMCVLVTLSQNKNFIGDVIHLFLPFPSKTVWVLSLQITLHNTHRFFIFSVKNQILKFESASYTVIPTSHIFQWRQR